MRYQVQTLAARRTGPCQPGRQRPEAAAGWRLWRQFDDRGVVENRVAQRPVFWDVPVIRQPPAEESPGGDAELFEDGAAVALVPDTVDEETELALRIGRGQHLDRCVRVNERARIER